MSARPKHGASASGQRFEADLLLTLTTVIAAAGWIFSKEALAGMPPLIFI
ncbi:EamA family transporter, partial [Thauera sp. UPWRP]